MVSNEAGFLVTRQICGSGSKPNRDTPITRVRSDGYIRSYVWPLKMWKCASYPMVSGEEKVLTLKPGVRMFML